MKKAIFTFALATVFALGLTAQSNLKILTVDVSFVFENYYKTQEANERLQAAFEQARTQLEELQAEGEALVEELRTIQEEVQNEALSEQAREEARARGQEKVLEVQEKQREYQQFQQQTNATIRQRQQNIREVMLDEIGLAIERIAEEREADLVLDASSTTQSGISPVLYGGDEFSITDSVLDLLNAGAPDAE